MVRWFKVLLLMLTCWLAPTAAIGQPAPVQQVDVILSDFKFAPSAITLTAGVPVRLRIVNEGSGGHDFTARDFFTAAKMDGDTRKRVGNGKISLRKGASIELMITPVAGTYALHCAHFLHSSFGMTGSITVR
jgi:uncharacterized cupredoxin-like copper-binding protein